MNFHPADPWHVAFRAELEALMPNISTDLRLVPTLPPQTGEQILEAVLRRGCQAHHIGNILLGRAAIAEIPRDWLLGRIENTAKRVLNLEDEWEYRRLLEICDALDDGLLRSLVARGLRSADRYVREAAEDFQKRDNAPGRTL
jgi:hypothetical protein